MSEWSRFVEEALRYSRSMGRVGKTLSVILGFLILL